MKTPPVILAALRDRIGAEAYLTGAALEAVVADLEDLRERERNAAQYDARLQQLEAARDDASPKNDDPYLNTETW